MGQVAKIYADQYTIAERQRWQDQWELIYRAPYYMSPAPLAGHQNVNLNIASAIRNSILRKPFKNCKVYIPVDWKISGDTVVQPDVLVVCKSIQGIRLKEAPEAIFEILSPATQRKDRTEKYKLYQSQKVEFNSTFTYRFGESEVKLGFTTIWE